MEHLEFITGIDKTDDSSIGPAVMGYKNNEVFRKMSVSVPDISKLTTEAKAATQAEHNMTLSQGLRLYPKAIGWSLFLSLAIIMEGYDTLLIGSLFAFPSFNKRYGKPTPNGDYQISSSWQSGLTNGALVGEILGLFINGIVAERYGYRLTMIYAVVAIMCFVFLSFFSVNIEMLEVAEVLCGIPWGVFQTLTTTYAAEVMPVALRAYLTSSVNLCWVIGQTVGSGILRGLVHDTSQWSYRIPFAVQWAWSIPILIGLLFAPESPWWLVRHGRLEDAKKSLRRLTSDVDVSFDVDETISLMIYTNELEKQITSGTSYWDCFKGPDLRRTEIACVIWVIQSLCGSALIGYSTYFYEQAGLPTEKAFDLSLGQYAIGIFGTVASWYLLKVQGRRTLYLCGLCGQFVVLMIIGGIGTRAQTNATSWVTGSFILVLTFIFDLIVGPVCYCLVAEIPSTRLRIKTVVLARNAYNIACIVSNILMLRMINPTAWDWKGKVGFFWAGVCILCFIWTFFRLPEPKGLTYAELDILFEKKASARKFRRFQVILEDTGYFCLSRENANEPSPWYAA